MYYFTLFILLLEYFISYIKMPDSSCTYKNWFQIHLIRVFNDDVLFNSMIWQIKDNLILWSNNAYEYICSALLLLS